MPLYRLRQNSANSPFTTEAIDFMSRAFEDACQSIGLPERTNHPLRDIVASKIIECAKAGEHDPIRMRDAALKEIRALASMGLGAVAGDAVLSLPG